MRIGQNPAKFVDKVVKPERITVAVLNFIPFLSGFYAEALDVLKLCLSSARENAGLPFDLMVFDNASCRDAQDWLLAEQRAGNIQYLYLSGNNIGKGGAWNQIFSSAPGEIIAYADSDVFFYPDWLAKSVELLETFPKVGMVTARPYRTREDLYSSTLEWARNDPDAVVQEGNLLPWEKFLEFDLSLGQKEADIRKRYEETKDYQVTYHGVTAQVGASHWQFTAYKKVLAEFLPFNMDRPMGQVLRLDEAMNKVGYLRLMPKEPYAMNLSNTVPEEYRAKAREIPRVPRSFARHLLDFPPVKKILLGLYNLIFHWYHAN